MMKLIGDEYRFSSRDLSGHTNCRHLTQLELQVAAGGLRRPTPWDPSLEALWERGFRHERDYLDHLADQGLQSIVIEGVDIDETALAATRAAMAAGFDVIVQAALASNGWVGRADVLRKVIVVSALGGWSYEAYDTKLSRSTNSSTILQLCLYSEMLLDMQGVMPEHMHVVTPWTDFEPQTYRVAEYAAYYRRARAGFGETVAAGRDATTYPDPTAHCDICSWRGECDGRRRKTTTFRWSPIFLRCRSPSSRRTVYPPSRRWPKCRSRCRGGRSAVPASLSSARESRRGFRSRAVWPAN
jgi:predicted RecB family nuclease